MLTKSLTRRVIRGARNFLLGAMLLFAGGLSLFSTPTVVRPPIALSAGVHTLKVQEHWLGALFRYRLRLQLEGPQLRDFDILVRSTFGHYRVESDAPFRLPVSFRDEVILQVTGPNGGVVQLREATLERTILPGGLVLLGLLAGLTVFFVWLAGGPFTGERRRRAMLMTGAGLAGLVVVAAGLEVLPGYHGQEPWHLFPPNRDWAFKVLPNVTPGIPAGVVRFKTNSEGLRARERGANWEHVFSVLSLGASTTEGLYLGEENHWPRVLENRLMEARGRNVWVGNAGRSGYSTARLVKVASDYVPRFRPKYLIVLTGFNEGIVPDQITAEKGAVGLGTEAWWSRIALARLARAALFDHTSRSPNDVDMSVDTSWYNLMRVKARQSPWRERTWEDLDLSKFEEGLRRLHDIASRHGSTLILCTQPSLYRADLTRAEEDLLWMGGNYTAAAKRRRMDVVNARLREVAGDLGVQVVDLDRELPRSVDVFYDDVHFNVNGARLVAELIFKEIFARSTRKSTNGPPGGDRAE